MSTGALAAIACCCKYCIRGCVRHCDCIEEEPKDDIPFCGGITWKEAAFWCSGPQQCGVGDAPCPYIINWRGSCWTVWICVCMGDPGEGCCLPPPGEKSICPCIEGETLWSDLDINTGMVIGNTANDVCTEMDQCCKDEDGDGPGDPCDIDFPLCCGHSGGTASYFVFKIECKGGYTRLGDCSCIGGKEDTFPECFGRRRFTKLGEASSADVIQVDCTCGAAQSVNLYCAKDKCGTVNSVPNPGHMAKLVVPDAFITNCKHVDQDCCPSAYRITDPTCGSGLGCEYLATSINPQTCPQSCSSFGCYHGGYTFKNEVHIPCESAVGGSNTFIRYKTPVMGSSLRVPKFTFGHICGLGFQGPVPGLNCVPVCRYGGSPIIDPQSWSFGQMAGEEITIAGTWEATCQFVQSQDPQSCFGHVYMTVTFTSPDFTLTWSTPNNPQYAVKSRHPCLGGAEAKGVFNWAQAIQDQNPSFNIFEAEDLLTNCGPLRYTPEPINATGENGLPGSDNSMIQEFYNEFWSQGIREAGGTELDQYRRMITDGFNVWGRNPRQGPTEAQGFSGCQMRGLAHCNRCWDSVYAADCSPVKARVDHQISMTAN